MTVRTLIQNSNVDTTLNDFEFCSHDLKRLAAVSTEDENFPVYTGGQWCRPRS